MPVGLPTGPWQTDEEAKAEIDPWCKNRTTGGGGWATFWTTRRPANSLRGAQHKMICCEHLKSKCKWQITLERSAEGWVIWSLDEGHTHALATTLGQANSRPGMRAIPDDLVDIGKGLAASGFGVAKIDRYFRHEVEARNGEVTWNYADVRHACGTSTAARALDATNLVAELQRRQTDEGLYFATTTDEDGALENVFFVFRGALQVYAVGQPNNVVMFDTKARASCISQRAAQAQPYNHLQHGTNRFNLKMGIFTTVSNLGSTKMLACSLLASETEASFAWAFRQFEAAFKVPPKTFFTDSDPGMAAALQAVWALCIHLLCTFHLSKNVLANVRHVFAGDAAAWSAFNSAWWRICLCTEQSSVGDFDREWASLLARLDESSAPQPSIDKARAWLVKLGARRAQWAARDTWKHRTLGVHSTQRSESVHAAVAGFLCASMLLTQLMSALDSYENNVSMRAEEKALRALARAAERQANHPLLDSLAGVASPHALRLLRAQLGEAPYYKVTAPPGEGGYDVVRITPAVVDASSALGGSSTVLSDAQLMDATGAAQLGLGGVLAASAPRVTTAQSCSCQFHSSVGVPCRHILAVLNSLQQVVLPPGLLDDQWLLHTDAQRGAFVERLLEAGRRREAEASTGGPAVELGPNELYALLCAEFRPVAELACRSPAAARRLRDDLAAYAAALRGGGDAAEAAALQANPAGRARKAPGARKSAGAPTSQPPRRCVPPSRGPPDAGAAVAGGPAAGVPAGVSRKRAHEPPTAAGGASAPAAGPVMSSDDEEEAGAGKGDEAGAGISNPKVAKSRGRPKQARIKSAWEGAGGAARGRGTGRGRGRGAGRGRGRSAGAPV